MHWKTKLCGHIYTITVTHWPVVNKIHHCLLQIKNFLKLCLIVAPSDFYSHLYHCLHVKFSTSEDVPLDDAMEYCEHVGCLVCLILTWADIAYAVMIVSQFGSTPHSTHWVALSRICVMFVILSIRVYHSLLCRARLLGPMLMLIGQVTYLTRSPYHVFVFIWFSYVP